ncbi:Hypothetical predicted protein [Mytilus galloprovincialis]|uniref:CCHC-type domain-containing protein n=1 Tax=Mytilus galloprovincialis TaxID=29158 RepID=A0A8B6ETM2_MYTGA|nr:Hypothetical predicted protein [Mytilus galloprovincialis]
MDKTISGQFDEEEFYKSLNETDTTDMESSDYEKQGWSTQRKRRKRMASTSPLNDNTLLNTPSPLPHTPSVKGNDYLLVLQSVDPNTKLSTQNQIKIQKILLETVGTPKRIKPLNSGKILVECIDKSQWKQLKRVKLIGVIYNVPLDINVEDEDIVSVLKAQKVSKIQRMSYFDKQIGERKPSRSIKLFFQTPQLPATINIGYKTYNTKLFVPKPIQCYKCQGFGHMANQCRNKKRCIKCGEEHENEQCTSTDLKYVNCKGKHMSNDKECPQRTQQKMALKLVKSKNISLQQATNQLKINEHHKESSKSTNKTPKDQSSVPAKKDKCTIQDLVTVISVVMHQTMSPPTKPIDFTLKSIMGFVGIVVKQMFGSNFDLSLGLEMASRVTTEMI